MGAERVKPPVNRKKNWVAAVLVLPGVLFVVFFMLVPLFSLCLTSFFPDESFSLSSYFSLFGDLYFQQVFTRSLAPEPFEHGDLCAARLSDGVLYRQAFPT